MPPTGILPDDNAWFSRRFIDYISKVMVEEDKAQLKRLHEIWKSLINKSKELPQSRQAVVEKDAHGVRSLAISLLQPYARHFDNGAPELSKETEGALGAARKQIADRTSYAEDADTS
jgi:hypothetical protein